MQDKNKIVGWILCFVSLILLASLGKLDLLVLLLPISAVLTFFVAGTGRKSDTDEPGKKGLA